MNPPDEPTSAILDSGFAVPDHVVYRGFEAETLLLNLESGQYHGINVTGGRMLEILKEQGGTVREAVRVLADDYEMQASEIEPDLVEFCQALLARGLLVPNQEVTGA